MINTSCSIVWYVNDNFNSESLNSDFFIHNIFTCFSTSDSKEARRGEKAKEEGLHASSAHDSSYFEIPTKEGHMANNGIHEIPTKDTEGTSAHTAGEVHILFILVSCS